MNKKIPKFFIGESKAAKEQQLLRSFEEDKSKKYSFSVVVLTRKEENGKDPEYYGIYLLCQYLL